MPHKYGGFGLRENGKIVFKIQLNCYAIDIYINSNILSVCCFIRSKTSARFKKMSFIIFTIQVIYQI